MADLFVNGVWGLNPGNQSRTKHVICNANANAFALKSTIVILFIAWASPIFVCWRGECNTKDIYMLGHYNRSSVHIMESRILTFCNMSCMFDTVPMLLLYNLAINQYYHVLTAIWLLRCFKCFFTCPHTVINIATASRYFHEYALVNLYYKRQPPNLCHASTPNCASFRR